MRLLRKQEIKKPSITWNLNVEKNHNYIANNIVVSNCHGSSSVEAKKLLGLMSNATYRYGCTGTMPDSKLDAWNVTAYLGPIFREYSAKYLKESGWIAPCTIKKIELNYIRKIKKDDTFSEVKDELFNNTFRLNVIKDKILEIKENVKLLLVEKVEEGGEVLKTFLQSCPELSDQEIVFISGKIKKDVREDWRQDAIKNNKKIILIGTYPIFQAGLNIPALQHVFFISPSKSKIRVMQSIGRSLRLYSRKDRAYIYDFIDNLKWFDKQSQIREKFYIHDDFDIEEEVHHEKDFEF